MKYYGTSELVPDLVGIFWYFSINCDINFCVNIYVYVFTILMGCLLIFYQFF